MRQRLIRHFFCCFLLLYHLLPAAAQSPARYKEIDDFIKADQLKVTTPADIKVFGRELKRLFTDDEIKARSAFFWLTQHIKYDCEGYRSGNVIYEPADVLAKGRAVCAGYAHLFKLFCDELGVECVIVNGFATGIGVRSVHADSLVTNHAWNAVKIKGQWKLVDPTWGSGSSNEDCTKSYQNLNEFYFFTDPLEMIRTHFPDSTKWQLLSVPVNVSQFTDSIKSWKKADDWEEPVDSLISKKTGETIHFRLEDLAPRNFFLLMVYNNKDSLIEEIHAPVTSFPDGVYRYGYKVKKSGMFRVDISLYYFTGGEKEVIGTKIVTYRLKVNPSVRKQP